jgi:hypothetical protein
VAARIAAHSFNQRSQMNRTFVAASLCAVIAGGCAVRLGGPKPENFQTLAYASPAGESAEVVAERIRSIEADIVLLASAGDSAWFADVANRAQLGLSGPGRTSGLAQAFLTRRLELLGDTSIVLSVSGGGRLHLHDALYQLGKGRYVDLMLVRIDADAELREAVRTLLSYIASDVGPTAALVFGLNAPTPQAADSVALLLRAAYANAVECAESGRDTGPLPAIDVRLFYGPAVRMDCEAANVLVAPGNPIAANLVVSR